MKEVFESEGWTITKKEKIAQLGDIEIWMVEGELEEGDIEDPLYGEWLVIAVASEPQYIFSILHGSEGTEIEPVPLVEKWKLLQLLKKLETETRARISPEKWELFWDPNFPTSLVRGKKYLDIQINTGDRRVVFFRTTRRELEPLLREVIKLKKSLISAPRLPPPGEG